MKKRTKTKKKRTKSLKQAISNILVPLDGSKNSFRALDFSIRLARNTNSKVTALSVIDLPPVLEYAVLDPVSKRLESKTKQFLKKAKNLATKKRVKFDSIVVHGNVKNCIIKYLKKEKADLVVIGARGLSGVSGLFLGSVSHYVIQKSKKPVLIVK